MNIEKENEVLRGINLIKNEARKLTSKIRENLQILLLHYLLKVKTLNYADKMALTNEMY
jgi:hypothetical protein